MATFSGDVTSVSLTGLDVGQNGFLMTAYDAAVGGSIVDTDQIFGSTPLGTGPTNGVTYNDWTAWDNFIFNMVDQTSVPEPSTLALLGLGLAGLGLCRHRKAN